MSSTLKHFPAMRYVGSASDTGQQREINEDSVFTLELGRAGDGKEIGLYVVADGMGGMEAGDVASSLTVETIRETVKECVKKPDSASYEAWLQAAVLAANDRVFQETTLTQAMMGSTVVIALVEDNRVYIASVGDSRVYLITDDELYQVTRDHSYVQALVDAGAISQDEAREHPYKNIITRSIGSDFEVEADFFEVHVSAGDGLLLCTDGLTNMITDDEILQIVRESSTPQEACETLVHAANDAGGRDNITAVIVHWPE
jgi:protein phosphatase